ncbi:MULTISPECIES: oxidoreductase [Paraburkholderia]|uniref:2-dehydropantoate 2-reductase n=1 Tax=Paraburkholderia graminis (strain ATCC 700544 / DSM 17151 / LMG 18924 / NCIMB 13744 / C4D1M) TaxID=396598 RepID=B1G382_PARG4|nr:oxidoreductase [Paraburkholderia graminis]EDT09441.1 2-dehydropantoate 2-reductase [Paraburkholderia graminis C4D1M]CAB3706910.1 2-dehydropantoate 2-reductase [Paraburkholderia graminis C4D1M]
MTMSENPTIALVGPGAIGTTVAAALHEVGRTPAIFGRSAHEQLELRFDGGRIAVPGPVRTNPAEVDNTFDLVFVAVKSTQIDATAPWLSALCNKNTVVCVLQNGVEQKALVAPHVPGSPVLPSVVWFPAQREPDASVWLRGKARITLPDTPETSLVLAALSGTRCSVDVAADFTSVAWRKLLQNAVAGLMVLAGRRAGMYSRADIAGLALAYLQECLEVARAEGATLGDEVPQEIVDAFRGYPADLGTSILADREAGRPLEWDSRNGVVQRRARSHGIATPISDLVVPLLAAASDGPG